MRCWFMTACLVGIAGVGLPAEGQERVSVAFGPAWRIISPPVEATDVPLDNGFGYGFGLGLSGSPGVLGWMVGVNAMIGMPVRPLMTTECSDGCPPAGFPLQPRTVVAPARLFVGRALALVRPGAGPLEIGAGPAIVHRSGIDIPVGTSSWVAGVTGRVGYFMGRNGGLGVGVDATRLISLNGSVRWMVSPGLQYRF